MEEFNRKEWKDDPVIGKLFNLIKDNHNIADHTIRVLNKNKQIKDFCEEARHFVHLTGKTDIFIHYDVSTWLENNAYLVRVERVGIYNDFMDYERARLGSLHGKVPSDIPNIN